MKGILLLILSSLTVLSQDIPVEPVPVNPPAKNSVRYIEKRVSNKVNFNDTQKQRLSNTVIFEVSKVKDTAKREELERLYVTIKEIVEKSMKGITYSKNDFVNDLKLGRVFTLDNYEMKKCINCFGSGKLSKLRDNADCNICDGIGTITITYIVKW